MKTVRLLIATTLALAALGGLVLTLAWAQPAPIRVEDALITPTVPLTLPPPWLSDDDVVDAPYHWWWPTVDGRIDPGEYAGAGKITFPGYGGDVEVFFKQDGSSLYVAFDFPDPQSAGSAAQVFLDTNHGGGTAPQTDDYRFSITRSGSAIENQGTGTGWSGAAAPVSWTAAATTTLSGWQAEFRIQYDKLGLTAGTFQVMGLSLINAWTPGGDYYWPSGAFWANPSTWGDLVSSSDWTTFYWKPGPWEDYAPSGMPDFDQMQLGPTYCGPFAAANSLWWFDSKFETPDHPPPGISDTYRLVWPYGPWDDHDPQNVSPLANDLAWYFDTDGIRTGGGWQGTYVTDMHSGTLAYLRDHGLWDDYIVTLVEQPDFDWIADEVQRSEDVILLLGFWEEQPPGSGNWVRIGGHYVTVAGVEPGAWQIAFSDPAVDNAEQPGPGRVLSGTLIPHIPIPGHPVTIHNDAGNVSHDVHVVLPDSPSPGGTWWIPEYEVPSIFFEIPGLNPNPRWPEPGFYQEGYIHTEIEFALSVSPFTWKSSGEWYEMDQFWQPWQDYAPNGVPDFDQKQDTWGGDWGLGWKWTFCGPAAAANSLWWFDSKFEPSPVGPPFPPPPWGPIPSNDNYPLVQSYDPAGLWDDHDPLNVDDPVTPWPPGGWPFPPPMPPGQGEFVEDLAIYFQTDQIGSGTVITNLYTGIEQYITDHSLRQGYVITLVESPEFWWVAEEVEVSEDVILLLGFWEQVGVEEWQRIGGHYLTLPGIDKQGGLVAFSDPYYDGAEYAWPYAYPTGWPTVMGRVADGWLTPHPPWGHASDVHNDAGNISHDVYYVVGTDSPGGSWGPWEYVEGGYVEENFLGQNGDSEPYADGEVQAEVEWAVTVSPVADVWITKTVVPTVVVPGGWVTFTITFGNGGSLPAENVVISDVLPSGLVNPSVVGTWNNYGGNIVTHDTFTWTVGSIPWQGWGIITVTAQINPTASGIITNTAEIATSSMEQYQISQYANTAQATFTVKCVKVTGVTLVVTNTGTIYTDTVVHFNADIAPNDADKPYNYRLTTDGTPGGVMASSADPLLFTDTFATTGTHTVEIAVWNCAMTEAQAVTDSVDVTVSEHVVCVDLTRIIIAGATTGYPGVYTFTTSYQPPNATPVIAYVWDNGGTAATSVRTLGVGTHTLMVTATNCTTALVTDTYTIVISATPVCTEVTGVTLVVTNTGAIYTDTVVHFNADIAPDDANKPYNYRLTTDGTPGGVMASSADPLLFTDTFATTGTHTVEIAVWNCAMTEAQAVTDSVDVTVSEHVVCVDLTRIIIAGATTGYPGVYTFTTSYQPPNATPVIAYVWDNGGTAATSVRTLGVGTHTLMVTATNCTTALVTDTYTIVISATPVCTEVTGVTLVVTNTGAIYTDTVVHFNADIAPDDANKPYNYRLTTDGTPGGVMASSADPLLFTDTFATTGTHTVEIAVWNCAMTEAQAVTDSVDVTVSEHVVCVDLTRIIIAGATTGYPGVYTFTTSYQPPNATPVIAYVWDNGGTAATSVRTLGVGTHTLMVTATNCTTALVTDTYTIVISATPVCTEVTGVTLVVTNTGAIYTDTVVHFNADIAPDDANKPYNYRLTTDGTPGGVMASSADPLLFTNTFATTGTHTVEIAVWNCAMTEAQAVTDSVDVTVSECVPPAGASFIYAPLNPLTGQTVVFTGSVALGDPPPTYTWDFGDGSGSGNPATHIYNSAGTYTVWMTATNSCGQVVYSDTVSVCEPAGNASIQYAPAEPWVNQTVFFTATATGSGLITYAWAADDGWMASGITATHAFTTLGNHTVWMTATNGCGQDYASKVILVRGYGVDLQPPSGSATGKPGGWITYTLTLFNTGNVTDTYNITGSVTGEAWPTNWPPTVGPVAGGGNAPLDVTVQITSSSGSSQVVITATSQGDGSKKAASVLTTTVTTQPVVRDVEIAPHTAAQTGDVGTTVTYTLRVTNTGTISDYFNLSVSGPAWGTVLSVYGLDLKPGEGQPVTVYVQIPAGAASGAQDAATVTARSAVAPAVADSAILTTTAYVPTYGVELTPLVAQQAGHPGDVMTYTLTVCNTGERDDTYTLSKGLHTWPTTLSVSSVGPLPPNGIAQFNVTVQIPASVLSGAFGTVQVTATSQKDNSKSDTAVLTTTAVASTQPITRGVTLTATITAREGIVGDWITYTLRVTNTGNVADFFNLTWQGNTWPVDLSAYGLSLGAGQGADVLAYVQPPLTASDGATDTVTIKATSANDATATDGVALTTTARWRHVYLPLVLRNHQ